MVGMAWRQGCGLCTCGRLDGRADIRTSRSIAIRGTNDTYVYNLPYIWTKVVRVCINIKMDTYRYCYYMFV